MDEESKFIHFLCVPNRKQKGRNNDDDDDERFALRLVRRKDRSCVISFIHSFKKCVLGLVIFIGTTTINIHTTDRPLSGQVKQAKTTQPCSALCGGLLRFLPCVKRVKHAERP